MKTVGLVMHSRINSTRCKNKMLRKFSRSSLFEIQLKKLNFIKNKYNFNVYCAIGENKLITIAKKYKNIQVILRNKKSVNADKINLVYNYLNQIPEENICFINACAPLLEINTLHEAVNFFLSSKVKSLTSVIEKKTWYFDYLKKPINDNSSGNTKDLKTIYECTHNFHIFNKNYFLNNNKYWANKKNDPYLYKVKNLESLDIDTEEEFELVEKIYKSLFI